MQRRMIVSGLAAVLAVVAGCGDSGQGERLARMAEQSTSEQSAQNQRVTQAHAELAEGSKRLVDAVSAIGGPDRLLHCPRRDLYGRHRRWPDAAPVLSLAAAPAD